MANRNLQQTADMFAMLSSSTSQLLCCRCSRTITGSADDQLLPVPFCARGHYVCRSCFVYLGGAMQYCPGCLSVAPRTSSGVVQQRATMSPGGGALSWMTASQGARRVNGGTGPHEISAPLADANGNGAPATSGADLLCTACGRATDQSFYCQSCSDVVQLGTMCQSCWQQHQLDLHVFPRLRLDSAAPATVSVTSVGVRSSPDDLHSLISGAGDQQQQRGRLAAVTTSSSAVLRQIRPRPMMSSGQSAAVSSLLGGLVMPSHAVNESPSSLVVTTSSAGNLLSGGLHDAAVRRRRLVALQAPLAGQYEGWLWQALNNGGFEQAARSIDERKQQIGVNLQSTLRDMEFRLERARGVLDDLYREYMRQVIEVSRCQMESLTVQGDSLQRVRTAASRLQHARVYNDKTRALAAETDLTSALRHNAASTCLRPCDDGWIEFRSPSDDELRAFLRSSCAVDSHVHAPHCSVQSVDRDVNCLSWTLLGRLSEFDVHLRNHCHAGVDDPGLTVLISDSQGVEVNYEYQRRSPGHYVVRYCPQATGTHHIYVLLRDRHIADSPYTVGVTKPLCYRLTDSPAAWSLRPVILLSYNLVKPWGVCCAADDSSHFLVADRDAHSVIVFDRNGSFVTRRTSSFRRPTHLAVTSRGHVVVTDKDNHRIQVFTSSTWTHVRTFGSEGERDGQFRYPWEVAVNSTDDILVSDSKNYRVQLFTSAGVFLAKHCLERASRDDKDGPRGVAFAPNDFAAVADFDMLRVLVLSPDLRSVVHVIGVPGLTSGPPRSPVELRTKGCIERPRGLAFDAAGNLIVVQARTNRETNGLVKFTPSGECMELQFDKDACGVCVCSDGRIAVVQPQTGVVIYDDV